jgi:hypothetical protein
MYRQNNARISTSRPLFVCGVCTCVCVCVCVFLYHIPVQIVICFSAKHGFLRCVYAASRYKCRKEEALFVKKIAETLSDTRVYGPHCKNVDTQLCSHSSTQRAATSFIVMTMLTATYFSLHKRISLCCWEVIITCISADQVNRHHTLFTPATPLTIVARLQTNCPLQFPINVISPTDTVRLDANLLP